MRPPARPGRAANQYNWFLSRSKPTEFSLGAIADTRNQVQKASVRENVVIHSVFQAIPLSQVSSFSGFHPVSTRPLVSNAAM